MKTCSDARHHSQKVIVGKFIGLYGSLSTYPVPSTWLVELTSDIVRPHEAMKRAYCGVYQFCAPYIHLYYIRSTTRVIPVPPKNSAAGWKEL